MSVYTVKFSSRIEASVKEVFDWHLNPAAFSRLTPPWEKVQILTREGGPAQVGSHLVLKIKVGPFWKEWVVQHQEYIDGRSFTDVQLSGPMKYWKHIHRFEANPDGSCTVEDEILFIPPFTFMQGWLRKKLHRMLKWRHEILQHDFLIKKKMPQEKHKILVSGSSGLIGKTLIPFLRTQGHEVVRLVRTRKEIAPDALFWDPKRGEIHKEELEGFWGVVHLAGKNIASKKWTESFKKDLFQSRARDTWFLSQALLRLDHLPHVFLCASAVGIYGNRGDEKLTEKSPPGPGFLADLCVKWEEASRSLESRGVRRVITRFGVILSPKGGMLGKILPLFRIGGGAIVGKGEQKMSWVALEDVVYALYYCLMNKEVKGPVNVVAPNVETNRSFSEKLAHALHAPLFFKIGEKPLRLMLGEMADEMLLTSTWAYPEALQKSGFTFFYPTLEETFLAFFGN